jgi:hemerythrin-like domain-containing protein
MRHHTLEIIRDEHQALAAMLRSLLMLLAQARREQSLPDFGVLRAMLFYIDEFPERLHHPKESELLFPRVAARCPELAPLIERLEREHSDGEHAVRELQHALLAFEMMGAARRAAFEQAAERYVRNYLAHMALEEQEILPAAQRSFTPQDWAPLDEAFAANADPLSGRHPASPDYRPLFQRILMTAPAPVGLGPA